MMDNIVGQVINVEADHSILCQLSLNNVENSSTKLGS